MAEQLVIIDEPQDQLDEPSQERHLMTKAALIVGGGILGATAGLGYAAGTPAEVTVAGMDAQVELTQGDTSQADLGLLGSITIPRATSVLGMDIGARVSVQGMADQRSTDTLGNTTINSFLQLFSDPEYELKNVQSAMQEHVSQGVLWGSVIGANTALAGIGGAMLFRQRASTERKQAVVSAVQLSQRTRTIAAGVTSFAVIAAGTSWTLHEMPQSPRTSLAADAVFEGTPLAGAELNGLLKPAVGTIAPAIEKYIKDNDAFYDEVTRNLVEAYAAGIGPFKAAEHERIIITASDRHCNIGMDRVIAKAAELYGAKTYITAGDDNMSGTVAMESACTAGLANRLLKQAIVPLAVRGNHDSKQTEKDEALQGYKVLDGNRIVRVNDVRIIGDGDPRRSAFGHPITPDGKEGDKVLASQSKKLQETACDTTMPVDIAVVHEPASAKDVIASSCVPLTITGHTHNRKDPVPNLGKNGRITYHFSEGTTGGAKENSLTLGPLKSEATMTIFRFDTITKTFTFSKITAHPDKQVTVTPFEAVTAVPGSNTTN